jgi:thiol-disulfide isomerase/thioredoxin
VLPARSVRVLVAALSILALSVLMACGRDAPPVAQVGTVTIAQADRQPLPPVAGTTLDGANLDLADLSGRVIVLNAWASWCEPCKQEIPAFVALDAAVDPADVAVVGLDVSDDDAAATAFATEYRMTYPSIVDPTGEILASLPDVPPKAIPSTLIIDRSGKVAARIIGVADQEELTRIVAEVSAETPSS